MDKADIQDSPGAYCTPGLPGTPGGNRGGSLEGGQRGFAPGGCLAGGD